MMRVLVGLGRWCRRHKFVVATVCLIATIVFVPMFPYSPLCYSPDVDEVDAIHLAKRYRAELTKGLVRFRVRYIVLGDLVLLTFWDWFADPDSWVANASNKSVTNLVDPRFRPSFAQPPDHIRLLAEAARDSEGFIEPTCELVRAVAIEGW